MKTIINTIAQRTPGLHVQDFATRYRALHPHGELITDDVVRQGYAQYNKAARKIARTAKAKPGTVGPQRVPR